MYVCLQIRDWLQRSVELTFRLIVGMCISCALYHSFKVVMVLYARARSKQKFHNGSFLWTLHPERRRGGFALSMALLPDYGNDGEDHMQLGLFGKFEAVGGSAHGLCDGVTGG